MRIRAGGFILECHTVFAGSQINYFCWGSVLGFLYIYIYKVITSLLVPNNAAYLGAKVGPGFGEQGKTLNFKALGLGFWGCRSFRVRFSGFGFFRVWSSEMLSEMFNGPKQWVQGLALGGYRQVLRA